MSAATLTERARNIAIRIGAAFFIADHFNLTRGKDKLFLRTGCNLTLQAGKR
jgi:hypothetical protein